MPAADQLRRSRTRATTTRRASSSRGTAAPPARSRQRARHARHDDDQRPGDFGIPTAPRCMRRSGSRSTWAGPPPVGSTARENRRGPAISPGPRFPVFPACRVANGRAWPGRRGHPPRDDQGRPAGLSPARPRRLPGVHRAPKPQQQFARPGPLPGCHRTPWPAGGSTPARAQTPTATRRLEPRFVSPNRTDQRPNRCWMKLAMGPRGLR